MNTNEWQHQAQGFTLATAINTGVEWTHAEIRTLQALKAGNMSIMNIAKELGRSYYSVSTKLISLGLSRSHARTNAAPEQPQAICPNCFTVLSKSGQCNCIG